jgi:DNA-binding CsgD family transcriptional regulator
LRWLPGATTRRPLSSTKQYGCSPIAKLASSTLAPSSIWARRFAAAAAAQKPARRCERDWTSQPVAERTSSPAAPARSWSQAARVRRDAVSGTLALTPSELRIAQLATDGLTNRQITARLFLTTKTIEMHLRNAYRKLDISSRRELPAALSSSEQPV